MIKKMLNKFIFIGNLTKDPEIRRTKQDKAWASLNVAVRGSHGQEAVPLFINGRAWGAQAEYIEKYVHKGDTIAVTSRLLPNNYVDSKGVKHYGVVFDIAEINKIKSPRSAEQTGEIDNEAVFTGFGAADDDTLPF